MKAKLLIFPSVLLLTFILTYIVLTYFDDQNAQLISRTQNTYIPVIETSTELHYKLTSTRQSLKDVVASSNESKLNETDSIAKEFIELCSLLKDKKSIKVTIDSIKNRYSGYYKIAKSITEKILANDFSEELNSDILLMQERYVELDQLINYLKINSKEQTSNHFLLIENNNRKSAIFNLIISLTGFIISLLISYFFSKAIAKPLQELNYELRTSEEELRQINEEFATTNEVLNTKNTELHSALTKLKQTQLQLIQSEKMASVGTLTAGVAHEINNPLNFIQGGITAIESYTNKNLDKNEDEINPLLEIVKTGVYRISNIVDSLNRFSRNIESNEEGCDVHKIIDNCLTMLNNKLKNKVEISREYCDEPFIIFGNEGKLHQVFLNILSNAEQAIESKGTITIKSEIDNKNIVIKIKDNGKGIDEKDLPKIIGPFFTTKPPGEGTGLGLFISHNIIKEHSGTLKFTSDKGKGTSVIIKLPIDTNN